MRMLSRDSRVCRAPIQVVKRSFQRIASCTDSSVERSLRLVFASVSRGSAGVIAVAQMLPVPT
ncbi:hypothetical protein D3C72_2020810 [compost metagenome]